MSITIDTRTSTTTQRAGGVAGHATAVLVPVRAGEMRKVSTRCECGWRSVAISTSREVAVGDAEARVAAHLAAVRTLAPVTTDLPAVATYDAAQAPAGRSVLVPAAALAAVVALVVVLAVGFQLLVG